MAGKKPENCLRWRKDENSDISKTNKQTDKQTNRQTNKLTQKQDMTG